MVWRVIYFSVVVAAAAGLAACSPESGRSTTAKSSGSNASQIAGSPQVERRSSGLIVTREPNGSVTYQFGQPGGAATRTPRVVPGEFLVKFKPHVSRASGMNSLSQLPLRSMRAYRSVAGLHHVRLSPGMRTEQALSAFRKNPDVEYIEPNYIVSINTTPNDPSFPSQWGLHNFGQTGGTVDADVDAPEAWDITTGSTDVVVAVIDTGVDYNHQDLAANIFRNSADCNNNGIDEDGNGFIDDCHGIDTANGDSDPNDDNGHGTHVSGIIGAVGNNGIGVAGVAWNVKILPCKFLDSTGSGATADAIACLDYVAAMKDRGVNIVASNNSWGGGFPSQALSDAIEAQMQRGILFVTAAGNAGENNDELFPQYPCSFDLPNILCVAASTDRNGFAPFSNFGSSTVHLAAPGVNILSTTPGNTYTAFSGTSMASPHVAGAVALVKSQDPTRDWRTIKNLILAGPRSFFSFGITISERVLNLSESLSCTNSILRARLRPLKRLNFDLHAIGDPLELSALHINCGVPAGNVTVTVSPGGETVTLVDDGTNGDKVAGDGIYTGSWTPLAAGTYSLTFPEIIDDVVTITVAPYLKRGFPAKAFFTTGSFRGGPGNHVLVGNIDSDPRLEILASGLASGPLFAWHHDGRPVTGWPNFSLFSTAYPSLGEFDRNSAGAEVAVNYFLLATAIHAGDSTFLPGWPQLSPQLEGHDLPSPTYDFDGDGVDEIVADGIQKADGTPLPGTGRVGGMVVADLDGDGVPEIISAPGAIIFANKLDGTLLPGFPASDPTFVSNFPIMFPVVGDVDGDGEPDIVITSKPPFVFSDPSTTFVQAYVFSNKGKLKRTLATTSSAAHWAAPILADLDGDGIPEIILQTDTEVYAWKGNGSLLPGWPVSLGSSKALGNAAPVVGDVDGDGFPDVVVVPHDSGLGSGSLHIFDRHGVALPGFPMFLPTGLGMTPAIADIDLDGRNDIIVAIDELFYGNKILAFDLGGPSSHGPIEWGQYMEGPSHRGFYELGKNLPNQAYLTAHIRGGGTIQSSPPGIACGADCIELYPKGTSVILTATPTGGGTFGGWLGACAGQGNPCTVSVQKYTTVVAQFSDYSLSVSVSAGAASGTVTSSPSGISCPADCDEGYNAGTVVTLSATPNAFSLFSNWSGACGGTSPTCIITMDTAKSVSANFVFKPLLTVSVTGLGTGFVSSAPAGINCGAACTSFFEPNTVVTLTANTVLGFFAGWSGACSGTATTCTVSMDSDKSVTANFPNLPTLSVVRAGAGTGTVTSNPPGINCGIDCSEPYSPSTAVTLTATPSANSTFAGWSGACSGASSTCNITMDATKTVTATFTTTVEPTRLLTVTTAGSGLGTVSSSPAGIACGADCSEAYNVNTVVTLTAAPSAASVFSGWTGACSGSSVTCNVTMDAATSVTATFTLKPVLTVATSGTGSGTVTSNPAGINCGGDCSEPYDPNTVVALAATPSAGSVFAGWSGACTGSGGCSITMDAAKSVTANFTLQLVLTVALSGTGTGVVLSVPAGISCGADCSEPYDSNVVVSLTATPSQGSVFDGWSGACAGQGNPCAVTMNSAKAVGATFTLAGSSGGSGGGGGGGGCTIGTDGRSDPSLPALLVLATMALWRRRRT